MIYKYTTVAIGSGILVLSYKSTDKAGTGENVYIYHIYWLLEGLNDCSDSISIL